MQQTPHNYTEDRIRRHPLTKRAHLAEQTGAPRIMHIRKDTRAHLSAYQRRIRTRGARVVRPNPRFGRTCPASRPGAFRGGVVAKAPDHLPYLRWRET